MRLSEKTRKTILVHMEDTPVFKEIDNGESITINRFEFKKTMVSIALLGIILGGITHIAIYVLWLYDIISKLFLSLAIYYMVLILITIFLLAVWTPKKKEKDKKK